MPYILGRSFSSLILPPVVDELSGAGVPQVNAEVASVVGLQRGVVGASLGGGQNLALEEGHYLECHSPFL